MRRTRITALLALAAACALPADAQMGPDGYTIERPNTTILFHGMWDAPAAEGEFFDFSTDFLTLGASDFATVGLGGSISFRVMDRLDLGFEGAFATSEASSEFRDYVEETDQGDLPIRQHTTLRRQYWTAIAKFYPLERGRMIGSYAWIPAGLTPYIGGGIGRVSYRFVQEGDFVDVDDLSIFTDYFQTTDSGWAQHAFGGMEMSINQYFLANFEARYLWGSSPVRGDFEGFDDGIDHTGFRLSFGVGVRL